jgi:hypothetical protein
MGDSLTERTETDQSQFSATKSSDSRAFPVGLCESSRFLELLFLSQKNREKDHPLASCEAAVRAQELSGSSFVIPAQHELATQDVARSGLFEPVIHSRQPTLVAVLSRVSLGGVAAVIPYSVTLNLTVPGVVYRPLADLKLETVLVGLFNPTGISTVVSNFVAEARKLRQ